MSNSDNPRIGKEFQQHVHRLLSSYFGNTFTLEYPIAIGNPPKHIDLTLCLRIAKLLLSVNDIHGQAPAIFRLQR